MFFQCSMALFMWHVARQVLGRTWGHANFTQFSVILAQLSGRAHRLIWFLFTAQSWAIWAVRNKLAIEKNTIRHPADSASKQCFFMQAWLPLLKPLDWVGASWLVGKFKEIHVSCLQART